MSFVRGFVFGSCGQILMGSLEKMCLKASTFCLRNLFGFKVVISRACLSQNCGHKHPIQNKKQDK